MGVYWLQGVHMIHCSYNSLWQGQFIQPDWDMFRSDHLCAEFHAGSRAICGGPVYVSDKVGCHDLDLLRKLVLPDGTILRCQHYALPTRDCLFENPLFGKTLLKLWNLNKEFSIEFLEHKLEGEDVAVIKIKGTGKFLAYSSIKPEQVILNNESTEFEWTSDGVLKFEVPWIGGELSLVCILISI
ncbi:hypothetical protein BUALT_Bualt04G0063900 [Buddleja alternifolia]|uniref:Galactinol--sucrose galactosyltransferase n=1 Tax=Buddleja alternifolia TaxID=168488 RepID=A0AAV6XUW5_9LAMI|nr:hypothetical protein BUALT_Bualt04G0063900 [Buddleja alternifolia]